MTLIYFNLWTGVDLFFVLSGFLISKGLWEEWQANSKIEFKKFYIKRALRILPAFFTEEKIPITLLRSLTDLQRSHLQNLRKAVPRLSIRS
ncbi:acyltransferase family protein [Leptospira mayottensis]|nr:acyltransferase [Leptospira mayottensis]